MLSISLLCLPREQCQRGFLRKVYGILTLQLATTVRNLSALNLFSFCPQCYETLVQLKAEPFQLQPPMHVDGVAIPGDNQSIDDDLRAILVLTIVQGAGSNHPEAQNRRSAQETRARIASARFPCRVRTRSAPPKLRGAATYDSRARGSSASWPILRRVMRRGQRMIRVMRRGVMRRGRGSSAPWPIRRQARLKRASASSSRQVGICWAVMAHAAVNSWVLQHGWLVIASFVVCELPALPTP